MNGVDGGRGQRSSLWADERGAGASRVAPGGVPLPRPGSAISSSSSSPLRVQMQRSRPASPASTRGAESGGDGCHHGARPAVYAAVLKRPGSAGLVHSSPSLNSPLVLQPRSRPASAASVREAGGDECHHGFSRRSLNSTVLSASVHSLRNTVADSSFSRSAVVKASPYLSKPDRAIVMGKIFDQQLRSMFDLLARGDDYIARRAETAALQVMGLVKIGRDEGCDDDDDEGWVDWPCFLENVKARGGAKKLKGDMLSDAIAKIGDESKLLKHLSTPNTQTCEHSLTLSCTLSLTHGMRPSSQTLVHALSLTQHEALTPPDLIPKP